jgi:hypothetical protein
MSRYLAAAAICASLLLAPAWASAGTRSINPAAAARTCSGQHGVRVPLGRSGPAYVAGFVTCVLRAERGQLGLRYTQNPVASQVTATAVRRFVALPYLLDHDPQAVSRAEALAAGAARDAVCPAKPGVSQDEWAFADTQPASAATPLSVAKLLGTEIGPAGAVARAPGAIFGVAARRGLLFEDNQLSGISLGVVAVLCP